MRKHGAALLTMTSGRRRFGQCLIGEAIGERKGLGGLAHERLQFSIAAATGECGRKLEWDNPSMPRSNAPGVAACSRASSMHMYSVHPAMSVDHGELRSLS